MITKLIKIEDVEEPQVGKFYLVPCVFSEMDKERYLRDDAAYHHDGDWVGEMPQITPTGLERTPRWLPVIGEKHEDAKLLGFPPLHYHFDFRFLKNQFVRSNFNDAYSPDSPDIIGSGNRFFGTVYHVAYCKSDAVVYRRLKMLRKMPIFPDALLAKLMTTYKGKKMLSGMRCPHKGAPLKGAPCDVDGNIVCPLHGLTFNRAGECVERNGKEQLKRFKQTLENIAQ